MALPNAQPKPRPRLLDQYDAENVKAALWKLRKKQVTARDGSRMCVVPGCKAFGFDPHHLLMRSKGGTDDLHNLVWVCRVHHREIHGHVLTPRWSDDRNRAKTLTWERAR